MKSPLAIHILTKNNSQTIDSLLSSIEEINCDLIVGDLGSSDGTVEKLISHDAKIIKYSFGDDFSLIRNQMIAQTKNQWILFIEPYETIMAGLDSIKIAVSGPPASYNIGVMQGDMLTRQTRLWHNSLQLKFTNPVFETIEGKSNFLNAFIIVSDHKSEFDMIDIAKKWHNKSPLSPDPIYYMACNELFAKNWDSFINYADLYLHQQKKQTMSYYMTNYYLAMVYCYIKKDYQNSLKSIYMCVIRNPTMAEFWCLLADIFYAMKFYDKAYHFYSNAKILGSRRLQECDWPMEISKYQDYPEKMMNSCLKILEQTKIYFSESE